MVPFGRGKAIRGTPVLLNALSHTLIVSLPMPQPHMCMFIIFDSHLNMNPDTPDHTDHIFLVCTLGK